LKPSVKIDQFSDEELVMKIIKTKDNVLFAELYDRYASVVYNKCLGFAKSKVEAEDLTHDIFIKLYMKLHTFKGTSKFSTWLYSFTYNFCVNYIQRNSYKSREKVQEVEIEERPIVEITEYDIFQIKTKKLKKVLSIIDPKDKMLLLLKYQDELSINELQNVLEISESAVKMRLKRAKEKVMKIYKNL
jgi:RNA polymerase sigma-70 factor (ECF subfamily)